MVAHLLKFAVAAPTRSVTVFREFSGEPAAYSPWMQLWYNASRWVG